MSVRDGERERDEVCVLLLGNVEENDTVSRALSRLSEVQEKVESLHAEQVPSPPPLSLSHKASTHISCQQPEHAL